MEEQEMEEDNSDSERGRDKLNSFGKIIFGG